jgi:hypothetical protein
VSKPDILRILSHFKKRQKAGDGWIARCPAHNDGRPSLSISQKKSGKIVLNCFAGCSIQDIVSEAGLKMEDLFENNGEKKTGRFQGKERVTMKSLSEKTGLPPGYLEHTGLRQNGQSVIIPYMNENGRVLHKKFRTSISGGQKYRYETGSKAVPYGLWKLSEARKLKTLVIVEGESDCWTLWKHDIPALGIPGANNYKVLDPSHISGINNIFIVQEPGKAGEEFVIGLGQKLLDIGYCGSVKVVSMPGDIKDPNDLYKKDPDSFKSAFRRACKKASEWSDDLIDDCIVNLAEVSEADVEFLWSPYVPIGNISLLAGKPGLGKSFLTSAVVASLSRGWKLPGEVEHREPEISLIFSAEDDVQAVLVPRLKECNADLSKVIAFNVTDNDFQFNSEGFKKLEMIIKRHRPKLIVFDPLVAFLGPKVDINRANEVRQVLNPLMSIASANSVAILIVAHVKKGQSEIAIDAVVGSVDFSAAVRSMLMMFNDPEDTNSRVVAHAKHNLSREGPTLRFEIRDGRFLWNSENCRMNADSLSRAVNQGEEQEAVNEAVEFLRMELREPQKVSAVNARGRKVGIPSSIIRKAARRLGLKISKRGFHDTSDYWFPAIFNHGDVDESENNVAPINGPLGAVEDSRAPY